MATLLSCGLTLEQSLTALIEEAAGPATREVLSGVKAELAAGLSFAGALGSYARRLDSEAGSETVAKTIAGIEEKFRARREQLDALLAMDLRKRLTNLVDLYRALGGAWVERIHDQRPV